MKNSILFFLLFISVNLFAQKLTDYADPFIGTGGHGHTYPGASLPFGMVQLSPDTDTKGWDWCSGYHYSDNSIIGFSHTHLSGTGCADYGDILFMPTTRNLKTEPGSKDNPGSGYRSRFSHKNESASPGYYSVLLDDYNIKAELTVTTRAGFHKYTFPESGDAHIIIDLDHGIDDKTTDARINIINQNTISGYRRSTGWAADHCVYFYAEFSIPFYSFGIADSGKIFNNRTSADGKVLKAFINYNTSAGQIVLVRVGISHTSIEAAKLNLQKEISGWDFDHVRRQAESAWEQELSKIKITTADEHSRRIFYTSFYHSLLNPNIFSDADGSYTGMDKKIYRDSSQAYTVFSLWDTFRAENPLLTILDPQRVTIIIRSMLNKYRESGLLPVWELAANETGTMIGYHSVPVITDAIMKGITGFDLILAFDAMKKSAMQDKNGLSFYKEMGYIPSDYESESVSKTLEYAYDDWCISRTAEYLWKSGLLPSAERDFNYFLERAKYYINVFDPSTSLMRAKKNGRWYEPFDPYSVSGNYTEANAWQYSYFVPQDINSLIELHGGDSKFLSDLNNVFTAESKLTGRQQSDITGLIGQYAHGNEPSHHMAYLFNYAGKPSETAERVHRIIKSFYKDDPDGLTGNEDCGQMSAWYVFSAMGFYPVCPGDNNYIIGTPLFEKAEIKTGEDKTFTITVKNLSERNIYIQSAALNGKDYPFSYLKHNDIMKGGELVFNMGPEASNWGTDSLSRPFSVITLSFTAVPFLSSGERIFKDTTVISLGSIDSGKIYYSIDGTYPGKLYSGPFIINQSSTIKAYAEKNSVTSKLLTSFFNKVTGGRNIILNTSYSPSYPGTGPLGLLDGIKGSDNFHTDAWQGYEGVDFDAVVDLGGMQKINLITTSFLQDTRSWIFYPAEIRYLVSSDGINFKEVYKTENRVSENQSSASVKDFDKQVNTEARYIKVLAKNITVCPPWHPGAGGKAWIFIDEITIK